MNLVVNARDAMPNGGKLTIATNNVTLDDKPRAHSGAMPGDYVMLSVSDTGTGMTDEVKAHLFEAFFTTKPKGKGTGLGLATCQTIVQQSGGHIERASDTGQRLDLQDLFSASRAGAGHVTKPVQTGPPPRGTETLLLVEDEPSVRHLAAGALEAQGYNVLRRTTARMRCGWRVNIRDQPIRLVVTDVVMPHMGGKVMAEWLKTTYPDLKILFTSGYTDDALAQHGVLEPGVAFLPKPYTPIPRPQSARDAGCETDTAMLRKQRGTISQSQSAHR
jgi:two-component system, cell cycle sensor histidine kinase and response regulator CckA